MAQSKLTSQEISVMADQELKHRAYLHIKGLVDQYCVDLQKTIVESDVDSYRKISDKVDELNKDLTNEIRDICFSVMRVNDLKKKLNKEIE